MSLNIFNQYIHYNRFYNIRNITNMHLQYETTIRAHILLRHQNLVYELGTDSTLFFETELLPKNCFS